jgi:hypothetical protein
VSVIRGPWSDREDPLGPARGVLIAVLLGLVLWGLAFSAWAVLAR